MLVSKDRKISRGKLVMHGYVRQHLLMLFPCVVELAEFIHLILWLIQTASLPSLIYLQDHNHIMIWKMFLRSDVTYYNCLVLHLVIKLCMLHRVVISLCLLPQVITNHWHVWMTRFMCEQYPTNSPSLLT